MNFDANFEAKERIRVLSLDNRNCYRGLDGEPTCRPEQPMAFMMDALCTTLYSIPFSFARKTRSVCVVALKRLRIRVFMALCEAPFFSKFESEVRFWPFVSCQKIKKVLCTVEHFGVDVECHGSEVFCWNLRRFQCQADCVLTRTDLRPPGTPRPLYLHPATIHLKGDKKAGHFSEQRFVCVCMSLHVVLGTHSTWNLPLMFCSALPTLKGIKGDVFSF